MGAEAIADLLEKVDDRIECDGLCVERSDGDYTVAVREERREGVDRADATSFLEEHPTYVHNWQYWSTLAEMTDAARYAFVRWLERADEQALETRLAALENSVTRTWGELLVRVHADDPRERRYGIRHVDDRDVDVGALDRQDRPEDARAIARFDEHGRYRPLKTAPSLPGGWYFSNLSATELVEAVEQFYPATIANWHREQCDELDVTHWTETAERQTGIYASVDELSPEALEWAATACCRDEACLKRRRWEYDDDTDLSVPPGEAVFPCREPCSFLIAAAKEFLAVEEESAQGYTIELTESERHQLEAIVDAVAGNRVHETKEGAFDDPANRYRTRYLRAKRFADGDGFQPEGN